MARLNLNPTRVSLARVKKNLFTASKGHKLLKDKRDELIRRQTETEKEIRELRERVTPQILKAAESFRIAIAIMGEKEVKEALLKDNSGKCKVEFTSAMNVTLPKITPIGEEEFLYVGESAELYDAARTLFDIKKELFHLAGFEKSAEILSGEAKKVGRRVNALEHVLIPNYQETIRYIKMRLEENDRANSIRLLKVKDMVIDKK